MRVTEVETFLVAPRWMFVKVSTDAGVAGWGEGGLEGAADVTARDLVEVVTAQRKAGMTVVKMNASAQLPLIPSAAEVAGVPIATGERLYSRTDFLPVLQAELLDYVANPEVFTFADGHVTRPTGPGLGVEIDEVAVRRAYARGEQWRTPSCNHADGSFAEW
jgi:L-alanine-DL-glutamate epimerase-like enolase superfamily enzyme